MTRARIIATGAATSLGAVASAAAAARARLLNATELDVSGLAGGAGLTGAACHAIDGLDRALTGPERLCAMLAPATSDLAASLAAHPAARTGVYFGAAGAGGEALPAVVAAGLGCELGDARVFAEGRAGTVRALAAALEALAARRVERAVVGGCESKLDRPRLEEILAAGRLKTSDYPVGFIPGEAAALCALELAGQGSERAPEVSAPAVAVEDSSYAAGRPAIGKALAAVLTEALGGAGANCGSAFLDLNGEAYRASDWAMALVRTEPRDAIERLRPELVALTFGNVGAAFPVLSIALATRAFDRGYARGDTALVCTSSDGGLRAAFTVRAVR
jgi:3-oxoacyl-[acyl-carrier-protein] synthase I